MSNTPFVESRSNDPVEQAIARRVQRILNDPTLDRQQRVTLVRKAQTALIEHRRHLKEQGQMQRQVAALQLPKGFKVQSIQVKEGRMQVGAISRKQGFVWLEAGQSPQGMAANQPTFQMPRPIKGQGTKVRKDPIAERRKAFEAHRA